MQRRGRDSNPQARERAGFRDLSGLSGYVRLGPAESVPAGYPASPSPAESSVVPLSPS